MHKKSFFAVIIFTAVLGLVLLQLACSSQQESGVSQLERGKYLVTIGGCYDCHAPKVLGPEGPVPDESKGLSGHPEGTELPDIDPNIVGPDKWILFNNQGTAAVGPWGISYSANLTPDDATGIGLWTEENFVQGMRTGKHMGNGRPILPPMPWPVIGKATDEDLKAMFAYLKSLEPINNKVPAPVPPDQIGK